MPRVLNGIPEQQNGGIGVSLIHGEDKFLARSSAVLIGLSPVICPSRL